MNPFLKAIEDGREAAIQRERNWESEVKCSGWLDLATEFICRALKNASFQGLSSVVVYWHELLDLAPGVLAPRTASRLVVAAKLLHDHIEALNDGKIHFVWKEFKPGIWARDSCITVIWNPKED